LQADLCRAYASTGVDHYRIAFNGTKGRLKHEIVERVYVAGGDISGAERAADTYQRASDQRGGVWSILIGAAANRCFETGAR
jgi:hypothetical protein